jgi:hypothetical protein
MILLIVGAFPVAYLSDPIAKKSLHQCREFGDYASNLAVWQPSCLVNKEIVSLNGPRPALEPFS